MPIGTPIVYLVPVNQYAVTLRGEVEIKGSTLHAEMTEFAGLIGRCNGGKVSLVIFVPNKPPMWIDNATAGKGPGQYRAAG